MNATSDSEGIDAVSEAIIGAAFEVSNQLGVGFLEKVYENALIHELTLRDLNTRSQEPLPVNVKYKGHAVGKYYADILVEGKVIVEIKCADAFARQHMAQCLNYLKATGLQLALLLNFQTPKVAVKRIVRNL